MDNKKLSPEDRRTARIAARVTRWYASRRHAAGDHVTPPRHICEKAGAIGLSPLEVFTDPRTGVTRLRGRYRGK